jgi:hypothetical protein
MNRAAQDGSSGISLRAKHLNQEALLKLRDHLTRLGFAGLALVASGIAANAQTLAETHELLPNDGALQAEFGASCDFSGTTGIIGARNDPTNGYGSGAAYLFDLVTGQELTKLLPTDGASHDKFGWSVAIQGDLAVVGAPFNQDLGLFTGSIYLFDTDTGAELAKILPNDVQGGFRFGYSVAIKGDLIFVGALYDLGPAHNAGSVYVIDRVTHQVKSKLLASDSAVGNQFGSSLDVSGDTVIVGAIGNNDGRGCAYLFDVSDPENPQELGKLTATDGSPVDYFGTDVAIDGNSAIVASPNADVGGIQNIGAAYIFDVTTGAELHKLTPPWMETNHFAASVSISGDTAIVGDPHANIDLENAGTAYVYLVSAGALVARLDPSHSTSDWGDLAGTSVELQGNTVLLGAPWHNHEGDFSGAAHLFHLEPGYPFCFGDSFSGPLCPCGNYGSMGEGCSNSTGSGAELDAQGSTNLSFDNMVLEAAGLPEGVGLFFQGNNVVWFGSPGTQAGLPFGDGLRCAGGGIIRLEVRYSSAGTSQTTISIATKGRVSGGDTKTYQYFYRDATSSPCGSGFNLSNGYQLTWTL